MQQTEKYKLNLIESSDPSLPDGLNQNTLKLEEVVSGYLEGMDARVTAMEAHKVALGSYTGTYNSSDLSTQEEQFMSIGFSPRFVAAWYASGIYPSYFLNVGASGCFIRSEENGFYVKSSANIHHQNYQFLAFC